jgi:hypothetical protein
VGDNSRCKLGGGSFVIGGEAGDRQDSGNQGRVKVGEQAAGVAWDGLVAEEHVGRMARDLAELLGPVGSTRVQDQVGVAGGDP